MPRLPSELSLTTRVGESRQARRDLDLHVDSAGLDPLKSNRRNSLNHAARPSLELKVTEEGRSCKNV
jgi:hypothetical protein